MCYNSIVIEGGVFVKKMKIGLDAGSTTVKLVALEGNKIVFSKYVRHLSDIKQTIVGLLKDLKEKLGECDITLNMTGSAGLGVAKSIGANITQEVICAGTAIREEYGDVDVCIELGGEDAKIIFFEGNNVEQRMNGSCAGGTGAFIDQMAILLDTDSTGVNELAKGYEKIYTIASRCGVFAKTDIQPLLNQGARKEDIAASIYQAIVNQTIAGLAQGKLISGRICFLGGPLTFSDQLRRRFIEFLELKPEEVIIPSNGEVFVAYGCALEAEGDELSLTELIEKLESSVDDKQINRRSFKNLFNSENEYYEFAKRHDKNHLEYKDINQYSGNAYLGIDAGSTTTKIILLSEKNEILYDFYSSNKGNPLETIKKQLIEIREICGDRINICGSASTGYGEQLIKSAFNLDMGEVETICHYKAAKFFMPNVDFIIDIGGQDMKCLKIKDDVITSIILNEACSSGCGSFIETFATSLGYQAKDFAKLGISSRNTVDLGSRCTVFMNSGVKQAQSENASPADISAGLAKSVVKNAIYKVIRANDIKAEYGENIVVQGGTFLNDAVLRAFEQEVGVEVIRPNIAGLMGAFGAALMAKELGLKCSTFMSLDDLDKFRFEAKAVTCKKCTNHCAMTVNTFANGEKFISGNKCEKGAGITDLKAELPNLYEYKYQKLLKYFDNQLVDCINDINGVVGLPLVLNMYENIPFWITFFNSINYRVELSATSNKDLYELGQNTIPSDTVCYPAKLVHGHIIKLIENEKVDYIFYPNIPFNFSEKKHPKNHYNCPVVACYPELIKGNVDRLNHEKYLMPFITLNNEKMFAKVLLKTFEGKIKATKKQIKNAYRCAISAYEQYRMDIIEEGKKAQEYALKNGKQIIVLAGRPYHIDPEVNHGIPKMLQSLDCVVISEDVLNLEKDYINSRVLNQWTYHTRLYDAAEQVASMDNTNMIQLVSFGCGLDSITTDEVKNILEENGKIYTQLKIDEINNLGAANIRIRSLLATMKK